MIKISKKEMEYFVKNGVKFGENGLFKTIANKKYYFAETKKNLALHEQFSKSLEKR